MEHLEKLSKALRYAGLNLNPQIISLILSEGVTNLVKKLDTLLKENPSPSMDEIDAIVTELEVAEAARQAEAEKASKKDESKKLDTK